MDDSELVEFLLNDDFNKEKTLLNQSLEDNQKEIITSDNESNKEVETNKNDTTNQLNLSKRISNTESEFLDDLDSIIMSTNNNNNTFTSTDRKNKNNNKKEDNNNEKNQKKNKNYEDKKKTSKPKSLLQKLNDRLEDKSANDTTTTTTNNKLDSTILLKGACQKRIVIGNKTVLVTVQVLNNKTGKIQEEKHFKVSDANTLILKTTASKPQDQTPNNETLTELLNPESNSDLKDSFKFKFTEDNIDEKKDTVQIENPSKRNRKSKKKSEKKSNKTSKTSDTIEHEDIDESIFEVSPLDGTVISAPPLKEESPNKTRNRSRAERRKRARKLARSEWNSNIYADNEGAELTNLSNDNTIDKENKSSNNIKKDNNKNAPTEEKKKSSRRANRSRKELKKIFNEKVTKDEFKRTDVEF